MEEESDRGGVGAKKESRGRLRAQLIVQTNQMERTASW